MQGSLAHAEAPATYVKGLTRRKVGVVAIRARSLELSLMRTVAITLPNQ